MTIQMITRFFMWCSILNVALLLISFVIVAFAGVFVYRLHSTWFPLSRETFYVICYSLIGFYKIMIFIFSVIPWIALLIIG